MSGKLTKAQRNALEMAPLRFSTLTGDCWGTRPGGYTVKVRHSTFNSLQLSGKIAFDGGNSTNTTSIYALTDAGREALKASQ